MMDTPLQLKALLWRAEHLYSHKEIITRTDDGLRAYTFAEFGRQVRRLANALAQLGIGPGDRVGTLAWNSDRHLEAYFAVPCMGAVLHTINLRLSVEQVGFVIDHADDRVLLVAADQLPILSKLSERLTRVKAVVLLSGTVPEDNPLRVALLAYEDIVAGASDEYDFPDTDENTAAGICYTSGTTGDPKGVVYSHRSTVLHALMLCMHGSIGVDERERYVLVTPMSHVNSWGMPYGCLLQGATIVLPGDHPVGADYLEIIAHSRASVLVAAVTVGMMVRQVLEEAPPGTYDISSLHTMWLGGQAPPVDEMRWWNDNHGVEVRQGWGMTEASPLLTFCGLTTEHERYSEDQKYEVLSRQGQPLPLVELKVVDDNGDQQPWDGDTVGEILVRAPWVARSYLDDTRSVDSFTADGWFRTGDIGRVTPDGYVVVVDRAKDLIKSGGEWISSVALENALIGHPQVREAAVVAAPDHTWIERPVAFIVARREVDAADLAAYLRERFPSFWVPDRFEFIAEVPKTGVGKFNKKLLRSDYL
ncbi:MAG: long-chain fatty acid--CoA ligase [Mycobacterium sp.]|jgi:fatty-acyl-CoA synthase